MLFETHFDVTLLSVLRIDGHSVPFWRLVKFAKGEMNLEIKKKYIADLSLDPRERERYFRKWLSILLSYHRLIDQLRKTQQSKLNWN